ADPSAGVGRLAARGRRTRAAGPGVLPGRVQRRRGAEGLALAGGAQVRGEFRRLSGDEDPALLRDLPRTDEGLTARQLPASSLRKSGSRRTRNALTPSLASGERNDIAWATDSASIAAANEVSAAAFIAAFI